MACLRQWALTRRGSHTGIQKACEELAESCFEEIVDTEIHFNDDL